MNQHRIRNIFILFDFITAAIAWALFFYFRKVYIENIPFEVSERFILGVFLIPFFWLTLYFSMGTYTNFKKLYVIPIISISLKTFLLGTIGLFFFLMLDDKVINYKDYYKLVLMLFFIHSISTLIPRLFITNYVVQLTSKRKIGFHTLLIGGSSKAISIYKELESQPKGNGSIFIGFVNLNGVDDELSSLLTHVGHLDDLESIIDKNQIEEVIIALDTSEQEKLKSIINRLQGRDITIKITSNMFDLLSGHVKMTNIFGALLIEINDELMPHWQFIVKRLMDLSASFIAIILLFPVYIIFSILVKSSSPGPIFFIQERIGKNGKPFKIIKFRTMYVNAEKNGPQLSSSKDSRITPIGKTMRKYRLDEIPQFFNVIKGDMSLVGPRPERQFYIDQIAEIEPQFLQLTKVKPGITSWGQVKYGYAENIQQMLQRMKYDLLYLKNMSIALDIKILLYTVLIVFKGSGK
ncbi:MAG: sugar transferase [Brumimicrobium sp.]|nr:sugar transferase [Brumimicrobium sp.]